MKHTASISPEPIAYFPLPTLEKITYQGSNKSLVNLCSRVNSLINKINGGKEISDSLGLLNKLEVQVSQIKESQKLQDRDELCFNQIASLIINKFNITQLIKNGSPIDPSLGPLATLEERSLYPRIFSFLTNPKDLCNLSLVSTMFKTIANHDDLWKGICQKEDSETCTTHQIDLPWKDFYKDRIDLSSYAKGSFVSIIDQIHLNILKIQINYDKAKIIHLKRLIHKQQPTLPIKEMQILCGRIMLTDHVSLKNFSQSNTYYLQKKNQLDHK